jgi:hypothetical protein
MPLMSASQAARSTGLRPTERIAMCSGSRPAASKRNKPGINLTRDKLPLAPNNTSVHGSIFLAILKPQNLVVFLSNFVLKCKKLLKLYN